MWTKETVKFVVSTKRFAVVLASVLSAASGTAVGYLVAKNRLERHYSDLASEEIQEAKLFYSKQNKRGEFSDLSALAEKYEEVPEMSEEDAKLMGELKDALVEVGYTSDDMAVEINPEEVLDVKQSIEKNIFDSSNPTDNDGGFSLDDELDKKAKGLPYILEAEEFFENESEYSQSALTYFEGDDVLVDERDTPIDNVKRAIGEDNLKFGCGSKDVNVVYIRNDRLNAEYEVTRSFGKFSVEVMGFIEHSDKSTLRKFRDFD